MYTCTLYNVQPVHNSIIDKLYDDCSGTIDIQMHSYFVSFFTDQDVPPATKGCVPEPVCL